MHCGGRAHSRGHILRPSSVYSKVTVLTRRYSFRAASPARHREPGSNVTVPAALWSHDPVGPVAEKSTVLSCTFAPPCPAASLTSELIPDWS